MSSRECVSGLSENVAAHPSERLGAATTLNDWKRHGLTLAWPGESGQPELDGTFVVVRSFEVRADHLTDRLTGHQCSFTLGLCRLSQNCVVVAALSWPSQLCVSPIKPNRALVDPDISHLCFQHN